MAVQIILNRSECGSPDRDFPTVVDDFCLPVQVSPRRSLFCSVTERSNLSTWTWFFACLLKAPEGLGSESQWKGWARGSGFPYENFSQNHPLLPPQKAKFLFCMACPPSRWPPLSTRAPKWAASTLTCVLNIVFQYHIYTFHIKIPPQHVSVQCRKCRHP